MGSSYRRKSQQTLAKRSPAFSSVQSDLFAQLGEAAPVRADLDVNLELLGAISAALREALDRRMSREQVVDRMNELLPQLPKKLTIRQLYSWTALSKEYHDFPARFLPAFCAAVDCDEPLRVLARALSQDLVDARELAAKRLGELQIESARNRRQMAALQRQLGA